MSHKALKLLLLFFIASLLLSLLFGTLLLPKHPSLHWDAAHYALLARNLAENHGFVNEPGHPTAYRPPLYPAMVSVVFRIAGEHYRAVYLLQAILAALTVAGSSWFAYRIAGIRAMIITGVLAALNPSTLTMTGMLLTEVTFSFLLISCLLFINSALKQNISRIALKGILLFSASGFLFGIATLCRPVAAGWAVLVCTVLILRRKMLLSARIVCLIVFLTSLAIPLVPWMARNNSLLGSPSLATTGGRTFWEFRHRDVAITSERGNPPGEFLLANEQADQRNLMENGGEISDMTPVFNLCPRYHAFFHDQATIDRFIGLSETEADREFYRMGIEYTLNNPIKVLLESLMDFLRIFSPLNREGTINPVMFIALPFLLAGLYQIITLSKNSFISLFTGLVSLGLSSFLILYEPRYRIPFEPFILIVAGVGIAGFITGEAWKNRNFKILFAVGFLVFLLASYLTLSGIVTS